MVISRNEKGTNFYLLILFSISIKSLLEGLFQSSPVDARSNVLFHLPALVSLD